MTNLTTTRPVAASTPLQENNLPANHLQLLTFNSRLFFIKKKGSGETKRMGKNTFVPKTQIASTKEQEFFSEKIQKMSS